MQVETPCMTETETPDYFIAPMSSGWTRFENSIYGDYDTSGCRPGLIAYLGKSEKALYPIFVRLTTGYNRTWTRVSLTNLQVLTGLSRNPVIKAVQSLVDSGLIESRNNGGVTEYRVVTENVLPFIAAKNAENRREKCTSENPASAGNEPNWRVKRAEVVEKTRQTSAGNEPPTRKEINNEKKKKKHVAPKNGAAQSDENPLTDSPQNQSSEVNVNLGAVTAPPSCENPPAADKPRSAKQLEQDTWLDTIALACGCFTPASETSDGKNSYHGKASRIGKEIKELKNLKVDLAELERMVGWFEQVNYRGKRAEKPKITDFVGELALFRAYEQSLTAITDPAKIRAIEAIKAVCVAPVGGWEVVAERLNKAADWFIEHGYADKISGFAAYWQEIKATAAPDLDTLYRNWNKYLSSLEGNYGANNSTPVYSKNSSRIHGRRGIEGDTPRVVCTITSDQLFA